MMKRPGFRREMWLLCAPLVGIGVAALVLTARERKRIERESGPLRLEIESIEKREVTPLEAWSGFDAKWRIQSYLAGRKPPYQGMRLVLNNFDAALQLGEISLSYPRVRHGKSIHYPEELAISDLLIKTNDLRARAPTLRIALKGECRYMVNLGDFPQGPKIKTQTATITVPFDPPKDARERASREAPVLLGAWKNQVKIPKPLVTISARVTPPKWNDHSGRKWECLNPRLLDTQNREVKTQLDLFDVGMRQFNPDGASTFRALLDVSQIPASRGKLTYEAWLSCDQSWPVKISCVVRS